jgi:hypothetical protein
MAGVFAPPKKYRMGSGGGSAKGPKTGGTILGMVVASMFPKPASSSAGSSSGSQTKRAFGGGSQARVNNRAVMAAERTSRRVPEVVVRITGRQHGGGHVLANFAYISRLGHGDEKELGLETSEGEVLRDGRDMQLLAKEWNDWEMDGDARRKGATSLSMILSMPTGTDPERLKSAALDFAKQEFANRSWVAGLHIDRDHPHVHLTIARRDHDGRRFHPSRDDLFRWRQRFAEKLRTRGIEANATPARARGIDPKHEPIAAVKMREKGQVPQIDKSRVARAQRFRELGIPDPVIATLAARQATVRSTYARSIEELSGAASAADKLVAQSLVRFVATMPEPEPNSVRAMLEASEVYVVQRVPSLSKRPIGLEVSSPLDEPKPLSTAERMRALHAELTAPVDRSKSVSSPAADPGKRQLSDVALRLQALTKNSDLPKDDPDGSNQTDPRSNRIRGLIDEGVKPIQPMDLDKASATLRRAEERNRERLERERTKDRDGPSR